MGKEYREEITFVHGNEEYIFKTEPNLLNNNQMWWFEPQKAMYAGTVREAKTISRNIKKNCIIK